MSEYWQYRRFEEMCKALATDADRISGSERDDAIVRKRWVIAYALRQEGCSLSAIGRMVNRHHSTIIHAVSQVRKVLSSSEGAYWQGRLARLTGPHVKEKVHEY